MATSWTRFVWQQPVGIPASASIAIDGDLSGSRTVTVRPFCRNASHIKLFETGGYSAASWSSVSRTHTYTFASDGDKTLYAAFRNPSYYTIGDDETIYDTVSIDQDMAYGIQALVLDEIVSILRSDATLATRDVDWATVSGGNVLPGWISGEVQAIGDANLGRMPFCEVRLGGSGITRNAGDPGDLRYDLTFEIRCWVKTSTDGGLVGREHTILKFLWEIEEALNAYPVLLSSPYVFGSHATADTALEGEGRSYRVGKVTHRVLAVLPLQDIT